MVLSGVYWGILWRIRSIFLVWKVCWPICYVLAASFNIWILLLSQSPYCFEKDFLIPSEREAFIFFSALFKQNMTLKGQENTARLKSFHPRIWLVSISGPWTEMRNEHYQGIPSSPRSQAHIYHHRHFLKEEISIQTPALLHTCRRQ